MALSGMTNVRMTLPLASCKELACQALRKSGVERLVDVDPGPLPPAELIARTGVMHDTETEVPAHRDTFLVSGYFHMQQIVETTADCGLDFGRVNSVFELGSGAARVVRHFRAIPDIRLVASDIDSATIHWCRENVPGVEFQANQRTPPLAFAADESFDLAIAMSVFTHIPLESQTLWANEMCRILRPGGFMVATVAGEHHRKIQLDGTSAEYFRLHGHVELSPNDPGVSVSTVITNTCDCFLAKEELEAIFGEAFDILRYVEDPNSLDTLVLRKPQHPGLHRTG